MLDVRCSMFSSSLKLNHPFRYEAVRLGKIFYFVFSFNIRCWTFDVRCSVFSGGLRSRGNSISARLKLGPKSRYVPLWFFLSTMDWSSLDVCRRSGTLDSPTGPSGSKDLKQSTALKLNHPFRYEAVRLGKIFYFVFSFNIRCWTFDVRCSFFLVPGVIRFPCG